MSDQDRLNRLLSTDPRDVGCDEAMAVLHIYVDLTVEGGNTTERYPGWRRTCWRAGRAARTSRVCWQPSPGARTQGRWSSGTASSQPGPFAGMVVICRLSRAAPGGDVLSRALRGVLRPDPSAGRFVGVQVTGKASISATDGQSIIIPDAFAGDWRTAAPDRR